MLKVKFDKYLKSMYFTPSPICALTLSFVNAYIAEYKYSYPPEIYDLKLLLSCKYISIKGMDLEGKLNPEEPHFVTCNDLFCQESRIYEVL